MIIALIARGAWEPARPAQAAELDAARSARASSCSSASTLVDRRARRRSSIPGREQGLTPSHWEPQHAPPFAAVRASSSSCSRRSTEELTFRGLGYGLLAPVRRRCRRSSASAILWALAHGLLEALPLIIALGIGLGWLRYRQDSTIPGMLLHATFNGHRARRVAARRDPRRRVIAVLVVARRPAWVAYVHVLALRRRASARVPLRDGARLRARRAAVRVTTSGTQEHVLITAGPRSSTGYSLEVERAVVERGRVSIVVREVDRPGRAKITYPYRLLVFRDARQARPRPLGGTTVTEPTIRSSASSARRSPTTTGS